MKRPFAISVALVMMLCLAGCGEASKIDSDIDNLGEITIDSYTALEDINQRHDSLEKEQKDKVDNYPVLADANKRMSDILYSELVKSLETAGNYKASYFAQYYDNTSLSTAMKEAQAAIDNSDVDKYHDCLINLNSEIDAFAAFVDAEKKNSFSAQTNEGEYPFAVDANEFPQNGVLKPTVKRSSNYPFQINLFESKTTDGLPTIGFCMPDGTRAYSYDYEITQEEIKEIKVEDENGDIKRAFVNTRIVLQNLIGESDDTEATIHESCYLLKDSAGTVYMVLPDMEGGDYFVTYNAW